MPTDNDRPYKEIGHRIADLRIRLGRSRGRRVTQEEVANAIDVATGTVTAWEGGRQKPEGENLRALAEFFEVAPEDIVGRDEKPNEPVAATVVRERAATGYGDGAATELSELDRRMSEILGAADLNVQEKSLLLLSLAVALRADALRARDRAALLEAEEAARTREELSRTVMGRRDAPPIPGQRTPVPRPSDESGRGRAAG